MYFVYFCDESAFWVNFIGVNADSSAVTIEE